MAKILVVDDDPDIVEAIGLVLRAVGHEVASANNRPDGMAAVEREKPDLLILDVMMEEQDDGFAMAVDLRKKGFKKPILMLSSISKVTGFQFGTDAEIVPVDVFEEKPIDPKHLQAKVEALLKGKEN
jgi:DNA-binding response OmpR family regulator